MDVCESVAPYTVKQTCDFKLSTERSYQTSVDRGKAMEFWQDVILHIVVLVLGISFVVVMLIVKSVNSSYLLVLFAETSVTMHLRHLVRAPLASSRSC